MENKYIKLLKQARNDFECNRKINYDSFKEELKKLNIEVDPYSLWRQIYNPGDTNYDDQVMGLEAYFKLLEYEELKQARMSSKIATWIAIAAIVISASISGLDIYLKLCT